MSLRPQSNQNITSEPLTVLVSADDRVDIVDLLLVLGKQKNRIVMATLASALLAAVVAFLLPNIYTATTRLLPPQQGRSLASAAVEQFANMQGLLGMEGLKDPGDLYVAMLQSRSVADGLIQRFELQRRYRRRTLTETREALKDVTKIASGKDSVITIEVDDRDPRVAARLANGYSDELEKLTAKLAITSASRRRLFLERQVATTKQNLEQAQVALRKFQEGTGLFSSDAQTKVIVESVAAARAQVAAKEVQLGAMRSYATENNPDLVRVQSEMAGLRSQLAGLERANILGDGDVVVPTQRVPQLAMEYANKYRDAKFYETLLELLLKQYELAKVDEAQEGAAVQVLDAAVEPERKSKPHRVIIVMITTALAFLVSIVWVFFTDAAARARANPEYVAKIALLKQYLSVGSPRKIQRHESSIRI